MCILSSYFKNIGSFEVEKNLYDYTLQLNSHYFFMPCLDKISSKYVQLMQAIPVKLFTQQ